MRIDPKLAECHAHAHIWLTLDFVLFAGHNALPSLEKHDAAPDDYVLDNARSLERDRLNSLRLSTLESTLQGIKDELGEVKDMLRQALARRQ